MKRLSYSSRAKLCEHPLAKRLFSLMDEKEINLALSADVTSCEDLLKLADELGPEICLLKTHVDILTDFSASFIKELVTLSQKHQFLIFEDRKFADIGNTVKHQYQGGIYHIAEWADIINAHSLPGPGIVSGLLEVGLKKNRGLLLLAEMSSTGNLIDERYSKKTLEIAEQFPEFVMGFIAQKKISSDPKWLYMTPGVQLAEKNDALGQAYITPEQALVFNQSDIIIVGRGILQALDQLEEAKKYRKAGFEAYLSQL